MLTRTRLLIAMVVAAAMGVAVAPTFAGRGGGGKPGGEPPADPAIAFSKDGGTWVCNADGSNQTRILDLARWMSWSPDGTQLVFNGGGQGPGVYVLNVDGTGLRKVVAHNGQGAHADWSPVPTADGDYKIVFSARASDSANNDIFLVNLDGTGLVNLTNTPDEFESDPFWSPEADRVAFLVLDGSGYVYDDDIVVCDIGLVDGSLAVTGTLNVTSDDDVPGGTLNNPGTDLQLSAWAKTQDLLLAHLNDGSDWIIDLADPANPVRIPVGAWQVSFSPDDSELVFQGGHNTIETMPLDGSEEATVIVRGKGLLFVSWRRNS